MARYLTTPAADRDIDEIASYIARDKPTAAVNWLEKLDERCDLLATSPEMSEEFPDLGIGVRASFLGRYVIYYRIVGGRPEILRVIAGDRDVRSL